MRELFEICPKIQFLKLSGCFLRFKLGELGQKRCKIECFDVSGTTWKSPCLSPGKMTIFPNLAQFFRLSLSTIWHSHLLQNYIFETYENRAIIKVCTISFERPVNYLCDAWHVFPPKYEAWTHFNN